MTDRSSKEVAAAAAETAIVSGSSAATAASFQVLAAKFVPYAMSACGTIIPGIGTIHVPGGEPQPCNPFRWQLSSCQ